MKANIKDKGKWGIYCIKNTVNQKVYVGKAIDIHRRIKQHITQLNTKSKDENIYLINAWHKHSRTAFEYSVLGRRLFRKRYYKVLQNTCWTRTILNTRM